jgi:hypothetical protein
MSVLAGGNPSALASPSLMVGDNYAIHGRGITPSSEYNGATIMTNGSMIGSQ